MAAGRKTPKKPAAKKAAPKKAARKAPEKKQAAKKKTAKYDLKTRPTAMSVEAFIAAVPNEIRRRDAKTTLAMMKRVTGEKPKMWGPSIVGFGKYHYKYDSGHEGEMCMAGFSPRAAAMVLYILPGFDGYAGLMAKLGKYRTGKSCLYINRFEDIDLNVLEQLVALSVEHMRRKYPAG